MMRLSLPLVGLAALALLAPVAAHAQEKHGRPGGFWKCKTGSNLKGEFNGEDPVGLSAGKHIPTDCAIHHTDGHGKVYCFSSMPSREFLDSNPELLEKAQSFWDKNRGGAPKP